MKSSDTERFVKAMFAFERPKARSAWRRFAEAAGLVALAGVVGYADYLTGSDVTISFFYFLPIGIASWRLGRTGGVSMAVLSALTQGAAHYFVGEPGVSGWAAGWNIVARLAAFLTVAVLAERVATLLAEERAMIVNLRKALADVNVLEGLLPICAGCKKIRDEDGNWEKVEHYIEDRTPAKFTHGMCPDCTKEWLKDAGLTEEDVERSRFPKV